MLFASATGCTVLTWQCKVKYFCFELWYSFKEHIKRRNVGEIVWHLSATHIVFKSWAEYYIALWHSEFNFIDLTIVATFRYFNWVWNQSSIMRSAIAKEIPKALSVELLLSENLFTRWLHFDVRD